MSGWLIFVGIPLSLGGLAYLGWTDPKRRRTHDLPKIERRPFAWLARLATLGPGIYLTLIGHWSGLTIWAGAITTLGWIMAAITPDTYAKLSADIRTQRVQGWMKAQQLLQHFSKMLAGYVPESLRAWRIDLPRLRRTPARIPQPAEIDALKARITALEVRLAKLETEEPDKINSVDSVEATSLSGEAVA